MFSISTLLIILGLLLGASAGLLIQRRDENSSRKMLLRAGASGAAYGLLIGSAVAMLWGNRPVDFEPSAYLIPVKSAKQFDALVKGSELVMVDFYADWCGPCHVLEPTIHDLANRYQGRVKVLSVDIDALPALAKRYKILNIPNVKLFRDGQLVHTWQGVRHQSEYMKLLDMLSE